MTSYIVLSMRFFRGISEKVSPFFTDLNLDLNKARMKLTVEEYLSTAFMTSLIIFLAELPLLSLIFGLVFEDFLFSLVSAFTVSIFLSIIFFLL